VALMMLTAKFSRRLARSGLRVNSYHPGVVPETDFGADMPRVFRAIGPFLAKVTGLKVSLEEAADTALFLAAAPEAASETGKYFIQRAVVTPPLQVRDEGRRGGRGTPASP
jgi:NAD(P)-dependent dehydrogenase (short-subunit alcohol dehydrogenase family)